MHHVFQSFNEHQPFNSGLDAHVARNVLPTNPWKQGRIDGNARPIRRFISIVILCMFALLSPAEGQGVAHIGNAAMPTAATKHSATLYGAHMDLTWFWDPTYKKQRIDAAAKLGAQIGRNSLLWALIETAPDQFDWTVPDAVVSQMAASGIEPLLTIQGSPAWANDTNPSLDSEYYLQVPQDPEKFDQWVSLYAAFVSKAVRRYKGTVHKWEIGNEQNWEGFWRPRPNLDQYASWYEQLSTAILNEDPSAEIAVGGLALLFTDTTDIGPNISGEDFIKGLWARGIYPTAIAIHPYSDHDPSRFVPGVPNFLDVLGIHQLLLDHGQQSTKLWITEFGWLNKTQSTTQKAAYLSRALSLVETCYSSFVPVAIYFPLFDNFPSMQGGLVTGTLRVSPIGSSFQAFVAPTSKARSPKIAVCPSIPMT